MYPKLYILHIHFLEKLGRYYGEPLLIGQSLRFTALLTSEIQFDSSSFGNGSKFAKGKYLWNVLKNRSNEICSNEICTKREPPAQDMLLYFKDLFLTLCLFQSYVIKSAP
jgi:hypothetical protein